MLWCEPFFAVSPFWLLFWTSGGLTEWPTGAQQERRSYTRSQCCTRWKQACSCARVVTGEQCPGSGGTLAALVQSLVPCAATVVSLYAAFSFAAPVVMAH